MPMQPWTLFLDGLAVAGGVFATGLSLLALASVGLFALGGLKRNP